MNPWISKRKAVALHKQERPDPVEPAALAPATGERVSVTLSDRQNVRRVNQERMRRLADYLMEQAARKEPRVEWRNVSLVLTDDIGIRRINRQFLGRDEATDVISFCYSRQPGEPRRWRSGEVFVNVACADLGGPGWGTERELALYIAHGCDHLTGGRDNTREARLRMRRRELRWLRLAERINLIAGSLMKGKPAAGARCPARRRVP
jgi:probable rRNA maturation factor